MLLEAFEQGVLGGGDGRPSGERGPAPKIRRQNRPGYMAFLGAVSGHAWGTLTYLLARPLIVPFWLPKWASALWPSPSFPGSGEPFGAGWGNW